jgi:hypothetical protein
LIDIVAEMLVQGGYRHFFTIKSRTNAAKVNQAVMTTQKLQKDTIFPGWAYKVPKSLVRLRIMLLHSKGLNTREIFRIQGPSWEVQALSTHVQKGTYFACIDAHAIATCLKVAALCNPRPISDHFRLFLERYQSKSFWILPPVQGSS